MLFFPFLFSVRLSLSLSLSLFFVGSLFGTFVCMSLCLCLFRIIELDAFTLDFKDYVKLPSKKNFQLIYEDGNRMLLPRLPILFLHFVSCCLAFLPISLHPFIHSLLSLCCPSARQAFLSHSYSHVVFSLASFSILFLFSFLSFDPFLILVSFAPSSFILGTLH